MALAVTDVVRSAAWYCDLLGLERRFEQEWGNFPAM
ncbi:MAG: VOC family protein, partial [Gemmatimonadota bacterium]